MNNNKKGSLHCFRRSGLGLETAIKNHTEVCGFLVIEAWKKASAETIGDHNQLNR